MAFTTSDIFAKVRRILSDTVEPYRWDNSVLRSNLQMAVKRLNCRVPTTRYVGDELFDYIELPVTIDGAIPINDIYEEPLVYYVASLCYNVDDPDTSNAELANTYLAKAERLMV